MELLGDFVATFADNKPAVIWTARVEVNQALETYERGLPVSSCFQILARTEFKMVSETYIGSRAWMGPGLDGAMACWSKL